MRGYFDSSPKLNRFSISLIQQTAASLAVLVISQLSRALMRLAQALWRLHWFRWVCFGVLYALWSWISRFANLLGTSDVDVRPGVVVPILVGLSYGPRAGFLVGWLGNLLTDQLIYNDALGNWHWSLGNGLMGAVPAWLASRFGQAPWLGQERYRGWQRYLLAWLCGSLGALVGMAFAAFIAIPLCQSQQQFASCEVVPTTFAVALRQAFWPALRVNLLSILVLLPITLLALRSFSELTLADWRSDALRYTLMAVVWAATLPIGLTAVFVLEPIQTTLLIEIRLLATLLLSVFVAVVTALVVTLRFTKPLLRVIRAAQAMTGGRLALTDAQDLRTTPGNSESAELAQVFGAMALTVIEREQKYQTTIKALQVEIDETLRQQQVQAILANPRINDLQTEATRLRAALKKRKPVAEADNADGSNAETAYTDGGNTDSSNAKADHTETDSTPEA
jgi:uncharacterized membrane protein